MQGVKLLIKKKKKICLLDQNLHHLTNTPWELPPPHTYIEMCFQRLWWPFVVAHTFNLGTSGAETGGAL